MEEITMKNVTAVSTEMLGAMVTVTTPDLTGSDPKDSNTMPVTGADPK